MITVPAAIPVTSPKASTVATDAALLLHVPPVDDSDNVIMLPTHTDGVPDIGVGAALTVRVMVAGVPHPFE